jgi:hypothetical protein
MQILNFFESVSANYQPLGATFYKSNHTKWSCQVAALVDPCSLSDHTHTYLCFNFSPSLLRDFSTCSTQLDEGTL